MVYYTMKICIYLLGVLLLTGCATTTQEEVRTEEELLTRESQEARQIQRDTVRREAQWR
jgi:hypothetical protein